MKVGRRAPFGDLAHDVEGERLGVVLEASERFGVGGRE